MEEVLNEIDRVVQSGSTGELAAVLVRAAAAAIPGPVGNVATRLARSLGQLASMASNSAEWFTTVDILLAVGSSPVEEWVSRAGVLKMLPGAFASPSSEKDVVARQISKIVAFLRPTISGSANFPVHLQEKKQAQDCLHAIAKVHPAEVVAALSNALKKDAESGGVDKAQWDSLALLARDPVLVALPGLLTAFEEELLGWVLDSPISDQAFALFANLEVKAGPLINVLARRMSNASDAQSVISDLQLARKFCKGDADVQHLLNAACGALHFVALRASTCDAGQLVNLLRTCCDVYIAETVERTPAAPISCEQLKAAFEALVCVVTPYFKCDPLDVDLNVAEGAFTIAVCALAGAKNVLDSELAPILTAFAATDFQASWKTLIQGIHDIDTQIAAKVSNKLRANLEEKHFDRIRFGRSILRNLKICAKALHLGEASLPVMLQPSEEDRQSGTYEIDPSWRCAAQREERRRRRPRGGKRRR